MILEWDYPPDGEPQRDTITYFWDIDVLMEYLNSDNPCQFSYQKTVEKIIKQKAKHPNRHKKDSSGKIRAVWRQVSIMW